MKNSREQKQTDDAVRAARVDNLLRPEVLDTFDRTAFEREGFRMVGRRVRGKWAGGHWQRS